jgi:2'-5' RNA ligase
LTAASAEQGQGRGGTPRPGRVPLLITAELPGEVFSWADALRRAHYPAERNRLPAHVTLFHALPSSAEAEIRQSMIELAAQTAPPSARTGALIDFGKGTAIAVESPGLMALHGMLAERLHGLLLRAEHRPLNLHITIQDKVSPLEARALQRELGPLLAPRTFRFKGLCLHAWDGEQWSFRRAFAFRGSPKSRG